MESNRSCAVGVIAMIVATLCASSHAGYWEVTQLTDNDYHDSEHQVSGNGVVWEQSDPPDQTTSILYYDGQQTVQLAPESQNPEISGSNIVWEDGDGLWLYDGITTTRVAYTGYRPQVNGSRVTWRDNGGVFVYEHNTGVTTQIGGEFSTDPEISDTHIAWTRGNAYGGTDVFQYDGVETHAITVNSTSQKTGLCVAGDRIMWMDWERGTDYEICLYDGNSIIQLTDDEYGDTCQEMGGDWAVWTSDHGEGTYADIFIYDGNSIVSVGTPYQDASPSTDGSIVAWHARVGTTDQVFVYDGQEIVQLTSGPYHSQRAIVSDSCVVWAGHDGNDWELFSATYVPEPTTMSLLAMGGIVILKRRRK